MKISLISTQLGMGGAENLVCNLADQFVARGHEVQLVSLLGEPVVMPKSAAVKIHNLRIDKRNPATWLIGLNYFARSIRAFKPDVVHAHSFHSIVLSRLLRPLLRYPKLVVTGHDEREGEGFRGILYKLTDGLSNVMTTIDKRSTAAVIERTGLSDQRVITVYNGIDVNKFQFSELSRKEWRHREGFGDEDTVLVAIGRLSPQKDFPNLLRSLKILETRMGQGRRLALYIAGTGGEDVRRQLDELIEELGFRVSVVFLGVCRDIPALLSAADVFVLSSAWEGFPLVVGEAMACERVVVATDCGGVSEAIGDAGFLCPPRNSDALAFSLQAAVNLSEQERRILGQRARARIVGHYSLNAATEQWLELYRTL